MSAENNSPNTQPGEEDDAPDQPVSLNEFVCEAVERYFAARNRLENERSPTPELSPWNLKKRCN